MISDLWQIYMKVTVLQSLIKLGYQHQDDFQHIYVAVCSVILTWKQKRQSRIDKAFREFEDTWQIE